MTTGQVEGLPLPGTRRVLAPEETWALAQEYFSTAGITRVADVTGLDCIGVPVFMAVRPMSETLAVSQGKGVTARLAQVSAVMESLELWQAERPGLDVVAGPIDHAKLTYPHELLPMRGGLPHDYRALPLDWVTANGCVSDEEQLVPADVVALSLSTGVDWQLNMFRASSNGLASGNTVAEAGLHGLLELIERHTTSQLRASRADDREVVDLRTVSAPHVRWMLGQLEAADVAIEVSRVSNEFDVPCFTAHIWSHEYPVVCAGAGANCDPAIAISRAISEAIQTRLTGIAGTRDDMGSTNTAMRLARRPHLRQDGRPWSALGAPSRHTRATVAAEFESVAEAVRRATGHEPMMVQLQRMTGPLAFVRVVAPGLRYDNRGTVPL